MGISKPEIAREREEKIFLHWNVINVKNILFVLQTNWGRKEITISITNKREQFTYHCLRGKYL